MTISENLKILGDYSTRMARGDYTAVYETFAPDFMSHVTARVAPKEDGSDIRGHEEAFWENARSAFPDMDFRVTLLIEHDDLIVSHWTLTGTHTGAPYYGVPASGERVTISGTAILRMRDGKVVEHWGGPHCANGIGLSPGFRPHASQSG